MSEKNKKIIKTGIFILLLAWLGFLMAEKIDLTTADLGRHLQNGKWVVENHFNLFEKNSPIHENFYSYTNPDFQVPNHHWGSGVLFYFIYKLAGFSGLSIFYIFLSLPHLRFSFLIAKRESNFTSRHCFLCFFCRLWPSGAKFGRKFSAIFLPASFLWALWKWQKKELAANWLYVLPILMIFWVNLHVYFFLGLFLIGVFWLSEAGQLFFSKLADEEFLEKANRVKNLTALLILSASCRACQPFRLRRASLSASKFSKIMAIPSWKTNLFGLWKIMEL